MPLQGKFREIELERERKHYELRKKIREANRLTRERRALKLEKEKNLTDVERKARKLEQHRNYRHRLKHKQKILKEQLINSIPIKVSIIDSHQNTMIMR